MAKNTCSSNPVELAIRLAGGRKQLAEKLSPPISRQAVESWLKKGEVPPRRVKEVSALTGIPKPVLSPLFKEN